MTSQRRHEGYAIEKEPKVRVYGAPPPQPSEEPASSGQPCCGQSPVRRRPRVPEEPRGRRPGGRRASWRGLLPGGPQRFMEEASQAWELLGAVLEGLDRWEWGWARAGPAPQSPTPRRSTQSHTRARSWRWCQSPSGPLSSPAAMAGRERDHLISGPTVSYLRQSRRLEKG